MKSKDVYHNRINYYSCPANGDYTQGPYNVIHDHVAAGPMVHGNMHTPNPWNYDVWLRKNWTGRRYDDYGPQYGHCPDVTGVFDCLDFALPKWESSAMYNEALEKLYEQIRGGLDLGVSIAEIGQTKRMFKGLREAEALARSVGSGLVKTAANGWLEFQYGWKPLYQDLFGAANEALNIRLNTLKKFSVTSRDYLQNDETIKNGGFTLLRRTRGKQTCKIVCTFELPGFSMDRFSSLNPVSLGWELIPYSFVIDWVLDIGSYLRSFETMCLYGNKFRSGYVSELYYVEQALNLDGEQRRLNSTYHIVSNDAWWHQTSFRRRVLSSAPAPYAPSVRAQMGWQRWLSAGALMSQLMH